MTNATPHDNGANSDVIVGWAAVKQTKSDEEIPKEKKVTIRRKKTKSEDITSKPQRTLF